MQVVTCKCPNCGAPANLGENVLAVICTYCGSQINRVLSAEDESFISVKQGQSALRTGDYEEADIHFSETLRKDPQHSEAWFCRAVTTALKRYGDPQKATSYLEASGFTVEEGVSYLSKLTSDSVELLEKCLHKHGELPEEARMLGRILLEAALGSENPAHTARITQAYVDLADNAWEEGQTDQAVAYMKKALQLDPSSRPQNLWLLELAQEQLKKAGSQNSINGAKQ